MKQFIFLRIIFITLVTGSFLSQAYAAKPGTYLVGIAQVDVTPDYPVILSGYASRNTTPIERVEQKLWARALVIRSQDQTPQILITVDNCGVPAAVTKSVVANLKDEYSIGPENLVICSTHTHAAPMLTDVLPNLYIKDLTAKEQAGIDRYTQDLVLLLTKVAQKALTESRPCTLKWGVGTARFAKNRRDINGPKDHSLPILQVIDAQNTTRAILVNYACHCTTLGGVPFMSGDWAGCAVESIEKDFPDCTAMVVIGCGADQNPKFRGDDQGAARVNGKEIAQGVVQRLQAEMTSLTGDLKSQAAEIVLNLEEPPTKEEWQERSQKKGITGYHAQKNLQRLEQGEVLTKKIDYPVKTWTFGEDLAMVFLGGEVVVDYSLSIKQQHGDRVWITAYANDVPCYIPSERVLKEGGYEGRNAMVWYDLPGAFALGLEKKIRDEVDRQLPAAYQAKEDVSRTGGKPALSPAESIGRMNIADEFKVEVIASEPLVVDPVAVDFGPDGKLWVVEMRDYPNGIDGNLKPGGVVKYLEDLNQDGVYDKMTVFLEGLAFPTGLMVWKEGVMVCTAPDVIYAEDTTGDGKADLKKTLLTGFATHNYQARVNSLVPGIDNWVYASGGLFGGVIKSFNGQTVNVTNRDFRFHPETGELEPVSGRTQQGRVRDDWGNWFGCRNGTLCVYYPVDESYYQKYPYVVSPPPEISVPRGNGANVVYPVGELVQFHLSGQRGRPTSACGLGLYRDQQLGAAFDTNAFVCEPVNQLVHRLMLQPEGVRFFGTRAPDEQERDFLTSTDNWFRPVQARPAPDGSLLIVDMYRYLIEHPKFLSPEAVAKLNVRAGENRGRIYRISRKGTQYVPVPNLKELTSPALAKLLNSSNGTLRDMVQQELILRADAAAVPELKLITREAKLPASRLQALCSLDGLQALDPELILPLIQDPHPGVRREALRLAEPFLNSSDPLSKTVLKRVGSETDLSVILQLAYSLGELNNAAATEALLSLMEQHSSNVYIRSAVLTSFEPDRLGPAITVLIPQISKNPKLLPAFDALLGMAVATRNSAVLKQVALPLLADAVSQESTPAWEWGALTRVLEASAGKLSQDQGLATQFSTLQERARSLVEDSDRGAAERIAAIEYIMQSSQSEADLELISELLTPQTPLKIQMVAIRGLINAQKPTALQTVLENWKQFTPAIRAEVLNQLLARESTTVDLLNSVEQKVIQPSHIDLTSRQRLIDHKNKQLSERARKLFAVATSASRAAVLKQYQSIDLKQASIERGSKVFEKQCATCHKLNGKGYAVGPDLAALTDQSKSFLLTSILDPNKAVDGRYASYLALTDDGRISNGILVSEQSNSITLKGQQGKVQTILRTQIDELTNTGKSLMPEGLEREIPPTAMADLLVFLQEHSAPVQYKYLGSTAPDANYPDDPKQLKLANHSPGSGKFNDGQWVGFRFAGDQPQPALEFDLGRKMMVRSLKLTYGVNHEPGSIHAPASVLISFSNNGKQFGNPLKFDKFDDRPDGLGFYEIDPRTVVINLPEQRARFVRMEFKSRNSWLFLSEIVLAESSASGQVQTAVPAKPAVKTEPVVEQDPVEKIKALVSTVKVGTPDEYREIPEIWRTAIALGKRNQANEIETLLDAALPETCQPLECWQAVVIGGGIINGITIAGEWPRKRIDSLLAEQPELKARWKHALQQAVKMADNPEVKGGTRYDALRMIALFDYATCQAQLKRYLADSQHGELQMGAVSGLGDIDADAATQDLIAALPQLTPRNRTIALEALLRTEARTGTLLQAIEAGKVSPKLIDAKIQQKLKTHSQAALQQRAHKLFD